MSDSVVLIIVLVQAVVCWAVLIWVAWMRARDAGFVVDRLQDVTKDCADRHLDSLAVHGELADALKDHVSHAHIHVIERQVPDAITR